jgi:hypothetical protein
MQLAVRKWTIRTAGTQSALCLVPQHTLNELSLDRVKLTTMKPPLLGSDSNVERPLLPYAVRRTHDPLADR